MSVAPAAFIIAGAIVLALIAIGLALILQPLGSAHLGPTMILGAAALIAGALVIAARALASNSE